MPFPSLRATGVALATTLLTGCLDPLVDDTVPKVAVTFPAPEEVPDIDSKPAWLAAIDAGDQLERRIVRRSAFAGGKRIWYWNVGFVDGSTLPLYALVEKGADGTTTALPHPYIVDAIPGDPGYTPIWTIHFVPVTDLWAGEAITSVAALQDAQEAGLVGEPEDTGLIGDCLIVHPDVVLETRDGDVPAGRAYYRGVKVPLHGLGNFTKAGENATAPISRVFQLRREGEEPIDERARGVDLTGDGDANDSNNLFPFGPGHPSETPVWQLVRVVVPKETVSIDTNQDEKLSDIKASSDVFDTAEDGTISPIAGKVVAFEVTPFIINCPFEPEPTL
ncbi:MAG: hypothetical protein IV100_08845 [Myxococcales bacterium]|nr:hypothetical protein [Myxococcales bacterium]